MLNQTSLQEMSNTGSNVQAAHQPWVFHTTQVCCPDRDVDHEKDYGREEAKPPSACAYKRHELVHNL
jgi:hypothetical protein